MLIRFVTGALAVATAVMSCGCRSLLRPSNATRHESYARYAKLFTGNQTNAADETYFILSGGSNFDTPVFKQDGVESGKIAITGTNEFSFHDGLAVALTKDGYLLTAAHVVRSKIFVIGWFDGRLGLRTARVVFRSGSGTHADVALIKVEAQLEHCATFGHKPQIGERVFSVVCYRKQNQLGGVFGEVAGDVLKVRQDRAGSSVDLVYTDIPLWKGDSGGPLLTDTGQLIGISTAYVFHWYGVYWKARKVCFLPRISFFPDERFIHDIIAKDRASHKALTPRWSQRRLLLEFMDGLSYRAIY